MGVATTARVIKGRRVVRVVARSTAKRALEELEQEVDPHHQKDGTAKAAAAAAATAQKRGRTSLCSMNNNAGIICQVL